MLFSVITSNFNQLGNLKKIKPYWDRQSCADFEWIIADDGSSDGSKEWCTENGILCAGKDRNTGYGLTECLNKASLVASGRYLVYVMGDSFPKTDFLEVIYKAILETENGMFCGVRFDTDWATDEVVQPEWRVRFNPQMPWWDGKPFQVQGKHSYAMMTLNTMVMAKGDFLQMGGIPEEYTGYGKMDWYMAAWTYYHHKFLTIVPNAIVYHRLHEDRADSDHNSAVFTKHLEELAEGIR